MKRPTRLRPPLWSGATELSMNAQMIAKKMLTNHHHSNTQNMFRAGVVARSQVAFKVPTVVTRPTSGPSPGRVRRPGLGGDPHPRVIVSVLGASERSTLWHDTEARIPLPPRTDQAFPSLPRSERRADRRGRAVRGTAGGGRLSPLMGRRILLRHRFRNGRVTHDGTLLATLVRATSSAARSRDARRTATGPRRHRRVLVFGADFASLTDQIPELRKKISAAIDAQPAARACGVTSFRRCSGSRRCRDGGPASGAPEDPWRSKFAFEIARHGEIHPTDRAVVSGVSLVSTGPGDRIRERACRPTNGDNASVRQTPCSSSLPAQRKIGGIERVARGRVGEGFHSLAPFRQKSAVGQPGIRDWCRSGPRQRLVPIRSSPVVAAGDRHKMDSDDGHRRA
jgi:hypothetical protein